MWEFLPPLLAQLTIVTSAAPPVVSLGSIVVYADSGRKVKVEFTQTPLGTVLLSSRLPAGWTFAVAIDGDRNGIWGQGAKVDPSLEASPDRAFGQDSRNGAFCSQYIFSSSELDPREIATKSECGGLASRGGVAMTGYDSEMRTSIVLEIPADEFFGDSSSARVQTCVWDTAKWTCQHRLPALQVLNRTAAAR